MSVDDYRAEIIRLRSAIIDTVEQIEHARHEGTDQERIDEAVAQLRNVWMARSALDRLDPSDRDRAIRYFIEHDHDDVEPLADAIYADYLKWRDEGWSSADAYCAIVNWLGQQLPDPTPTPEES